MPTRSLPTGVAASVGCVERKPASQRAAPARCRSAAGGRTAPGCGGLSTPASSTPPRSDRPVRLRAAWASQARLCRGLGATGEAEVVDPVSCTMFQAQRASVRPRDTRDPRPCWPRTRSPQHCVAILGRGSTFWLDRTLLRRMIVDSCLRNRRSPGRARTLRPAWPFSIWQVYLLSGAGRVIVVDLFCHVQRGGGGCATVP
jgi:hypothetical protein